jgi:hypothetical protein
MSDKRWFVLRPIKLARDLEVLPGTYLTEEHLKHLSEKNLSTLVNNVRLYDIDGQFDTPWRERSKLKLRQKCLAEIPGLDAPKIAEMITDRLAAARRREFMSPREKAIADQIEASGKVLEEVADAVEEAAAEAPKPRKKASAKKVKEEKQEEAGSLDDLLG